MRLGFFATATPKPRAELAAQIRAKRACTRVDPESVILQVAAPAQAPPQATKREAGSGTAVRTTSVPRENSARQSSPHEIPGGELTTLDQHPADSGTNLADADREEASLEVLLAQEERVREALSRLDAGSYGKCVDCGRALPDERLEARPEAERCVDCQQKAEARR